MNHSRFGGKFKGAQRNWTTYEKEAYAVVQTLDRLDYLFWGANQIHVLTDHRNLLYVFAPLALRPNSPRHVLSKVHRWAIHLSRFEFFINRIEGKSNVFADILTRWSKGFRASKVQTNMIAALYKNIIPSSTCLPAVSTASINSEQAKHEPPKHASKDKEGSYKIRDKIWVPNEATNLKLMIAVNSHCEEKGHRPYAATMNTVYSEYWWTDMKLVIKEFIQSCIHYIVSRHGKRIPRLLSAALHGKKPTEVVHANFVYMGPAEGSNLSYVLIIKDYISSYIWLWPFDNADSDVATTAIGKWITCFGGMDWLATDQGSHFKASLMNNLTKDLHIKHHFTTAYCRWANRTVERVCKEVLCISRALLSEWKLPTGKWPVILDVVQRTLNHSSADRLGKYENGQARCPMEVFLGLKPSPLIARPSPLRIHKYLEGIDEERCRQIANIEKTHNALQQTHKGLCDSNQRRCTQAQQTYNARTNVLPINFEIGDQVMIRTHAKRNHKLQSLWRGPMKVIDSKSTLVFTVEDITTHQHLVVHAQRMIPYRATRFGEQASQELKEQAVHYDSSYHLLDAIRAVRKRRGEYEMLVSWVRFEKGEDETWEPLGRVMEDMPGIL